MPPLRFFHLAWASGFVEQGLKKFSLHDDLPPPGEQPSVGGQEDPLGAGCRGNQGGGGRRKPGGTGNTHIRQKEARETRLYVIAFGSQVSKAENGLTLVSVDNGAPVATLGVVVKAGAR